jgi:hypothetical protein
MQSRLIASAVVRRLLVDEIDMVRSILTTNIEEYVGFLSEAHIKLNTELLPKIQRKWVTIHPDIAVEIYIKVRLPELQ